jgi:hypothetical protein
MKQAPSFPLKVQDLSGFASKRRRALPREEEVGDHGHAGLVRTGHSFIPTRALLAY